MRNWKGKVGELWSLKHRFWARSYKKVIAVFTCIDLVLGSVFWITGAHAWVWVSAKLLLIFLFAFCFYVARLTEGVEAAAEVNWFSGE